MARKLVKNARKAPQSRSRVVRAPRKAIIQTAQMSVLRDPRALAWDRLLRDPCSAAMAHPCYAGADSGYLVRTTDLYTPTVTTTGLSVGGVSFIDVTFQATPFNASLTTGCLVGSGMTGTNYAAAAIGYSNFVTNIGTAVARYRPVAACVKYIPFGPFANRAGLVGSAYSPGMLLVSGDSAKPSSTLPMSQRMVPIGEEIHEVRWLPSAVDEAFTTTGATAQTGAGSIFMVLKGVDATNQSATVASLNGSFEVTIVWEWIPTAATGAVISPQAPLPYTSQQVLSTISDMGNYVFHGLRSGVSMVRDTGTIVAGSIAIDQMVRRAAAQRTTRGQAFIR